MSSTDTVSSDRIGEVFVPQVYLVEDGATYLAWQHATESAEFAIMLIEDERRRSPLRQDFWKTRPVRFIMRIRYEIVEVISVVPPLTVPAGRTRSHT